MYERCERLRPTLFRLASDTGDDDDALGKLPLGPGGRGHPLYLCCLEGDGWASGALATGLRRKAWPAFQEDLGLSKKSAAGMKA